MSAVEAQTKAHTKTKESVPEMEQKHRNSRERTFDVKETERLRAELIGEQAKQAEQFRAKAMLEFGPAAGVLLEEVVFWCGERATDLDGGVYKTYDEMREKGLSRWHVRKARETLHRRGILTWKDKGVPPKAHYYVDLVAVMDSLYPVREQDQGETDCVSTVKQTHRGVASKGQARVSLQTDTQGCPDIQRSGSIPSAVGEPVGSPPQEAEEHVAKNSGKGEEKQHRGNGYSWAHRLAEKVEQAHGESLDDGERAKYAKQFGNLTSKRSVTDEQMQEVLVMISRKWDRTQLSPQLALGDVEKGEEPPPATAREEKQEKAAKKREEERKVLSGLQGQGFPVTASEDGNYMLLPDGAKVGYGEIMVGNEICGGDDDDRDRPLMEWLDRNPEAEIALTERQETYRQHRREQRERLRRQFQERDEPFSPLERAMIEYLEKRPSRARQMPNNIAREVWQAGLIDHMPGFGEGNAEFEAIGGRSIPRGVYPSEAMRSLDE